MHVITSRLLTKPLLLLAGLATLSVTMIGHANPALESTPSMASSTDSLEDRLARVAEYYGDASGHIDLQITGTSQTLYVATAPIGSTFSLYTIGQSVAESSSLAACSSSLSGTVSACDPAYGETMLFALEDLQAAEPDPSELTVACNILSGSSNSNGTTSTAHCMITWNGGNTSCYICVNGTCEQSKC